MRGSLAVLLLLAGITTADDTRQPHIEIVQQSSWVEERGLDDTLNLTVDTYTAAQAHVDVLLFNGAAWLNIFHPPATIGQRQQTYRLGLGPYCDLEQYWVRVELTPGPHPEGGDTVQPVSVDGPLLFPAD